jgi:(p)ppGpp synthase/HD superfamily hydrolase
MLTDRFNVALGYAELAHRTQTRKGSDIPYVSHLLGVCALVFEYGGDEDQAIAALLHDAVEDQGGAARLKEITRLFGARVSRIVECCTDAYLHPKPPWKERKKLYLAELKDHDPDSWLVTGADKLYKALSIMRDYRSLSEALWERFNGGRDGTLWYYRSVADELGRLMPGEMADDLEIAVMQLETLTVRSNRAQEIRKEPDRTRPKLSR